MGKLVVLKIIDGSFERGFTVMLQIGHEAERPLLEMVGKLPPLPTLPELYDQWRASYWRLDSRYRISAKKNQRPNVSLLDDCLDMAQQLKDQLRDWLLTEDFRALREKWLECLSRDEEIRIILQTQDPQLRQLPWSLMDMLNRYPKAELALSALNTEAPPIARSPTKSHVSILSIIGDSNGIDTTADQALLANLPHAHIKSLVEPTREQLNEALWQDSWDILFFAGHSSSQGDRQSGKIFLNKTDSLSIQDLKYALRKSVENGLQLAIFNSCDGLGLAQELADLRIPQVIVMREPVPDRVAQQFLKHLLSAYAQGTPLYQAVRQARERLQGLEDQFPCATWLPLICQHPAVAPPTWQDFIGLPPQPQPQRLTVNPWRRLAIAVLSSLTLSSLVGGVRLTGLLQPAELAAFDQMLRLRPLEPPDPRLLVVTIDDEDLRMQRQQGKLEGASISNQNLSDLLKLLTSYKPRAIGLDLYRDTTTAGYPALVDQLKHNPNLITVCKTGYDKGNPYGIAPPPEIPREQFRVGFSDFTLDPDEVVRRHLLAMNSTSQVESLCQVPTAFSLELVWRYLGAYVDSDNSGIAPDWNHNLKIRLDQAPTDLITGVPHAYWFLRSEAQPPATDSHWQPYDVMFPRLEATQGGYQGHNVTNDSTQLLLNYRATSTLEDIAIAKPLRWFLSRDHPPSAQLLTQLIAGKIVLIGVVAREKDDFFKTPYGTKMEDRLPGVFVHAHMISQLLSHTLDGRPLLWVWSAGGDWSWVLGWGVLGGVLGWMVLCWPRAQSKRLPLLLLLIGLSTSLLYAACLGVLIGLAGWVPFVPAVLALVLSSGGVVIVCSHSPRINASSNIY